MGDVGVEMGMGDEILTTMHMHPILRNNEVRRAAMIRRALFAASHEEVEKNSKSQWLPLQMVENGWKVKSPKCDEAGSIYRVFREIISARLKRKRTK